MIWNGNHDGMIWKWKQSGFQEKKKEKKKKKKEKTNN